MTQPTDTASASLRTEADVMREAANHTDNVNDSVSQELARVQDVAQSTSGFWQGAAQSTFSSLMVRYDDAERRLSEALRDIALNIRDNASNYEEAEAMNAEAFQTIAPDEGLAL
ncbi:WXG100 family type VII secretion target [Corynebacterium sp. S7]